LLICQAYAGGRGGHNTTWDPNLFGGGWVCLKAAVAGCSQGFNATCDGIADDTTAYTAFITAFVGLKANLYIPPRSKCKISWSPGSLTVNSLGLGTTPASSLNIWGYGSSWNANFTSGGFTTTVALISTANIGDSSVTLLNPSDAANFAVGRWVCVCGLELQHGGFPPNFQFYEMRRITNIVGSVITLSAPLANQYLSTWPLNDTNDGPASIWLLDTTWDSNISIYGLRFDVNGELVLNGRTVQLYDVSVEDISAADISANQSFWSFYSSLGAPEIDKDIEFAGFFRSYASQVDIQSPSPNSMIVDNSVFGRLVGTPKNLQITNSKITNSSTLDLFVGPTGFGHGVSITADGLTVDAGNIPHRALDKSIFSFSSGVFTIPNANVANVRGALAMFVPGQKYYFSATDGTVCAPQTAFTVTGIDQDASNLNVRTDIVGSLPSPTCGGSPYFGYQPYGAATITQKFSGPADLTQFAAPP